MFKIKKEWSRKFKVCTECKTKCNKHVAKGLCTKCYAKLNSAKIVERKRIWRINNLDKFQAQVKHHNKTENHRFNCGKYKRKHRKSLRIKAKIKYHQNPTKFRISAKKYRIKNKDKIKARNYANRHQLPIKNYCEICKSQERLMKHHINYEKQEIITVCCRCNNHIRFNNLESKSLKKILQVYNLTKWR